MTDLNDLMQAMVTLTRHYLSTNEMGDAEKWAERAVEAGSGDGYYYSMLIHNVDVSFGYALGHWDNMLKNADIVVSRANVLLNAHRNGNITMNDSQLNTTISTRNDGLYGGAYAIWMNEGTDDFRDRAIERLEGINTTEALTLLGLCYVEQDDIDKGFPILKKVSMDEDYRKTEKSYNKEAVYCQAMQFLADLYRVGYPRLIPVDLNKSVEILTSIANSMKDEELKGMVQNELNKYQKKMFGGYKYIE